MYDELVNQRNRELMHVANTGGRGQPHQLLVRRCRQGLRSRPARPAAQGGRVPRRARTEDAPGLDRSRYSAAARAERCRRPHRHGPDVAASSPANPGASRPHGRVRGARSKRLLHAGRAGEGPRGGSLQRTRRGQARGRALSPQPPTALVDLLASLVNRDLPSNDLPALARARSKGS